MRMTAHFLMIFGMAVCIYCPTYAQETVFSINFDSAHIVGTKENIIAHRVPVRNGDTGDVTLLDVTVRFSIGVDGRLVLESFLSMPSSSQLNSADNFISGIYADSAHNCYVVSGGGTTTDGRPTGSVRSDSAQVTFNASWIGGPVEGHPILAGLENGDQFLGGLSYGSVGPNSIQGFCNGRTIGAIQTGTSISITAFHQPGCGSSCCSDPSANLILPAGQSNLTLSLVTDETECNTGE